MWRAGLCIGVIVLLVTAFALGWGYRKRQMPAALGSLATSEPVSGEPWFVDVAIEKGLDFVHESGPRHYYAPEIIWGGSCVFDHDGDGDLDVYLVQAGDIDSAEGTASSGNRLFANDGKGSFLDVTEQAGVGDRGFGMGCTTGDIDRDGDLDLLVTNVRADVLYLNQGDGTFTDVTTDAGLGDPGWNASAAFFDHDADGDLDLFVVRYLHWSAQTERACATSFGQRIYCGPAAYDAPTSDLLYENQGDGTFVEASGRLGIDAARGNGLGLVVADFDRDGWLDVYVANDAMPNNLWINQGGTGFEDHALILGTAVNLHGAVEAGMGVVATDIEDDGDLDIVLTHLSGETNTCYVFEDGAFSDGTARLGLAWASLPRTAFGIVAADFDHDRQTDLFVATGRVTIDVPKPGETDPYAEFNQLFRGLGGGRHAELLPRGGTAEPMLRTSRSVSCGDLDADGDIDLVVLDRNEHVTLLENRASSNRSWIQLRVVDERGHEALGALVCAVTGSESQWGVVQRASSYLASIPATVHFGLGDAEAAQVSVRWLDGTVGDFGKLAGRKTHTLKRSP